MKSIRESQCHDYKLLMRRWRVVAKKAGLKMRVLAEAGGWPVYWLERAAADGDAPAWYISAGVHGDEAGATAGLIRWAEASVDFLCAEVVLIFPCLNPHGLICNTRFDELGFDRNRRFHLPDDPVCGAWQQVLKERQLRVAICLHEDYDGQGCYLYELNADKVAVGRILVEMAATVAVPVDPRKSIDGMRANHGVIRKRKVPEGLPGMPEAVMLFEMGCPLTLTFETPSEFQIEHRVEAQVRFLQAVTGERYDDD